MSINLHGIVRSTINTIHADEPVNLFQSAGQTNIKGELYPVYFPAFPALAQVQSEGGDVLTHTANYGQTETARKFYLYSDDASQPAGIIRYKARGGDLIQRTDGSYWLITAVQEDFHAAGWVCVRAVLQINDDDFSPAIIETGGDEEADAELPDTDESADIA